MECAVKGCRNKRSFRKNGVSFHRFPEDPFCRAAWIEASGWRNRPISKNTLVCSDHFLEEDLNRFSKKTLLREGAILQKNLGVDYKNSAEVTFAQNAHSKVATTSYVHDDFVLADQRSKENISSVKRKMSTISNVTSSNESAAQIMVPSHPFTLTCCIPDCTSNQNTPGIQWLSVPYSRVDQERDLPTESKSGNLICHKHFADCFLIKGGTYVTESSSIHEYVSKTERAAENAGPTIFAERLDESVTTSEKPKTHTMNFEKLCRTCSIYIANEQEQRSLFKGPDSLKTNRPDILEVVVAFGLKIQEDDNLPQQICQLCLQSFSTVIQFRNQCRRFETKLLEYYKQLSDKNSTEVSEPIDTNESVEETIVINDDVDVPAAADSSHRKDPLFGGQELPDPLDVSRTVVIEVSLPQQNNDDVDADEIATAGNEIERLIANVKERVEKSQNDFNDIQEWEIEKRDEWSCEYFMKLDDVYMASDGEDDRAQEYKENKQQPKQQNKISNETNTSHATYTSQVEKTYHTKIPEVVNFECEICNRFFSSTKNLLLHQDSFHFAGPVTCGVCRTKCETMDEFREHKKGCRKPTERANNKCDYCDYQDKAPAVLKQHMRKHTREKPFLCDTCGASFPYEQGFKEHLKGHTDVSASNFLCDYCDKKFTSLRRWRNHRTFHITDHRHVKVICKVCDGKFPKLVAVYKHMRDEHKLTYKMHTLKMQREFLCCICSERFNDYLTVKRHVELSHAEQLLSCNKCGSVHPDRISLVKHIQLNHIDEMAVKCGICDEQFTSVNLLQEHIKEHCDDKPLGSPDIIEQLDESESDSE